MLVTVIKFYVKVSDLQVFFLLELNSKIRQKKKITTKKLALKILALNLSILINLLYLILIIIFLYISYFKSQL